MNKIGQKPITIYIIEYTANAVNNVNIAFCHTEMDI